MASEQKLGGLGVGLEPVVGPLTVLDRGKLYARLKKAGDQEAADEINAMQGMLNKLIPVMDAAVALVCAPGWAGLSDEDCELEAVLRGMGFVRPNAQAHRLPSSAASGQSESALLGQMPPNIGD